MKKFFGVFFKGKQKQGNMYSLCDVSLPVNDNDILQKNAYKHYHFDSDCINASICGVTFVPEIENNSLNKTSANPSRLCTFTSTLTDLELLDPQLEKDTESPFSNFSKSSSESSLEETPVPERQEQKPHLEGIKKSRKNMYVITVNNSKYFHIGSQKTVNIGEKALPRGQVEPQPCIDSYSPELQARMSQLLDCETKLTEKYITLISQHANDNWREFLKNLGLEESFVKVLETRNDNNKALTLYDSLQEYITLYPNTSLGFVVNALSNTQQGALIEKLAQEVCK